MLLKRGLGWKIVLVFGLSLILCSYNESAIRPQVVRLFNAVKGKGFKVISTTTKLDARGSRSLFILNSALNTTRYALLYRGWHI